MKVILLCGTMRAPRIARALIACLPKDADFEIGTYAPEDGEPAWESPLAKVLFSDGLPYGTRDLVTLAADVEPWSKWAPPGLVLCSNWRRAIAPELVASCPVYVLHDSLLPDLRGCSASNWAVILGRRTHGVSLFRAAAEVDSGVIVGREAFPIEDEDTIVEVTEKVTCASERLVVRYGTDLLRGYALPGPGSAPSESEAAAGTWVGRIREEGMRIDWTRSKEEVCRLVRGLTRPFKGAWYVDPATGLKRTVWKARPSARHYVGITPGAPMGEGWIAAADGPVQLLETEERKERK